MPTDGGFADETTPSEAIECALGAGPQPHELPRGMLCPGAHPVERHLLEVVREDTGALVAVPAYPCGACHVVCRFQECQLRPGDEGRP